MIATVLMQTHLLNMALKLGDADVFLVFQAFWISFSGLLPAISALGWSEWVGYFRGGRYDRRLRLHAQARAVEELKKRRKKKEEEMGRRRGRRRKGGAKRKRQGEWTRWAHRLRARTAEVQMSSLKHPVLSTDTASVSEVGEEMGVRPGSEGGSGSGGGGGGTGTGAPALRRWQTRGWWHWKEGRLEQGVLVDNDIALSDLVYAGLFWPRCKAGAFC